MKKQARGIRQQAIVLAALALLALAVDGWATPPNAVDIQCIHYRNDYRRPAYCDPGAEAKPQAPSHLTVAPVFIDPPHKRRPGDLPRRDERPHSRQR